MKAALKMLWNDRMFFNKFVVVWTLAVAFVHLIGLCSRIGTISDPRVIDGWTVWTFVLQVVLYLNAGWLTAKIRQGKAK